MYKNFTWIKITLCLLCAASGFASLLDLPPRQFAPVINNFNAVAPLPEQGGSFINDVYLLTTSDGAEWVLKAENPRWPHRKTLNEVSALQYLTEHTAIPLPHIEAYHTDSRSSPLEAEYIVMTRMPGKPLNLIIDTIYTDKPRYHALLNDLADIVAQLHSLKYDHMGNVEKSHDALCIVSPIEFPLEMISTPCHAFSEYAFAWLSYYVQEMTRLIDANHPNKRYFSLLVPQLQHLLDTQDFSRFDTPDDEFVYCHQDFVMKNILVEQDHVSAVLDWEWSGPALAEFEIQTGFDFLLTHEDQELFASLMQERGFPRFFQTPPLERQRFYHLIGDLYALISCYEWIEGKLEHSAKFLAQKLEQRRAKKDPHFDIEQFSEAKTQSIQALLKHFVPQPIAFFGLSGVGKTTLAQGLVACAPDQFELIPITTSRSPRSDDDPHHVEFLSNSQFLFQKEEGLFALSWEQDGNHYGYRQEHLNQSTKHPLMTCSLCAVHTLKNYGALTILIMGNGEKGLDARGDAQITQHRTLLNLKNTEKYLNQPSFHDSIDIHYDPLWGDISASIFHLHQSIRAKIGQPH